VFDTEIQTGHEGAGKTPVGPQVQDMVRAMRPCDPLGSIRRAVVHHQPFHGVHTGNASGKRIEGYPEGLFFIEAWYLNNDFHVCLPENV
jgi:hypothetical protein